MSAAWWNLGSAALASVLLACGSDQPVPAGDVDAASSGAPARVSEAGAGSGRGSQPALGATSGGSSTSPSDAGAGGARLDSSADGATMRVSGAGPGDGGASYDSGDGNASPSSPESAGVAAPGDVTVDPSTVHQLISGFGASTAWMGTPMTSAQADMAFSTTSGAGLSLDRMRINYQGNGTSAAETATALLAQARGARVWATPWTPPVADKDNGNPVEGHLTNPSAFVSFLVNYVAVLKAAGVDLYALSAQNEPDANVTYESCAYTPAALAAFIGGSLGPAFAGSTVKLIAPETQNWCSNDFEAYAPALESNGAAWSALSIVATHEYGCTPAKSFAAAQGAGKEFWATEAYDPNKNADPSMTSGLWVASMMYDALVNADVNAWHYWWFFGSGSTYPNQGLWDNTGQPTKRLWVMGNFSRFVRPGFERIDVPSAAPSGVSVVAFFKPSDGSIVVVAINRNASATPLSVFVTGTAWPSQVTPWVTSPTANLSSRAVIALSAARFGATLDAQSVTTFVGAP